MFFSKYFYAFSRNIGIGISNMANIYNISLKYL